MKYTDTAAAAAAAEGNDHKKEGPRCAASVISILGRTILGHRRRIDNDAGRGRIDFWRIHLIRRAIKYRSRVVTIPVLFRGCVTN